MKLSWFSPLPPVAAESAEYTRHVLPELAKQADVTLWTFQDGWDRRLEDYGRVRLVAGDIWHGLNQADVTFFHLGNNAEHYGGIWDLCRQHPGVEVLHDVILSDLFVKVYLEYRRDEDRYLRIVRKYHGDEGYRAALELLAGTSPPGEPVSFPPVQHAIERALAVVVPSREAESRIEGRHRVSRVELPYAPRALEALRREPRGSDVFRLIEFGSPDANRRLEELLEALARMPQRKAFQLDIYGDLADGESVRRSVRALALADRVRVHGRVDSDQLEQALRQADLAIHLRWPSGGGASLDLLRIWEHALPCLVMRAGWYRELDPEAVWFVRPEEAVGDIQDALAALAHDPDACAEMGRRGRAAVERNHDPARCAKALMEVAAGAVGGLVSTVVRELAERAAEEIRQWPGSRARAGAAKSVSEALSSLFDPQS